MRALLILISLLFLVGCTNEPTTNEKEPTYLACTDLENEFHMPSYWVVLDHANNLWIDVMFPEKPSENPADKIFAEFFPLNETVDFDRLRKNDDFYWHGDSSLTKSLTKLDRKSLILDSLFTYQCEIIDDLSYLRSIGVEKNRNKI